MVAMVLSLNSLPPSLIPQSRPEGIHIGWRNEQINEEMNKQADWEARRKRQEEKEGPAKIIFPFVQVSPGTCHVLCTCAKRWEHTGCANYAHLLHLPGRRKTKHCLNSTSCFLTLKPCLTAHTQIKTSLLIVSSTVGSRGFFSREKPVIHLLD